MRSLLICVSIALTIYAATAIEKGPEAEYYDPPPPKFISTVLTVIEPKDVVSEYKSVPNKSIAVADFGHVPWGRTLIGVAYYADPKYGCSKITPIDNHADNPNEEPDHHPIIVVQRGECSFAAKAANAMAAGAKALIIVDTIKGEDLTDFLPIEDFHRSINIPTIMIDEASGQTIIRGLTKKTSTNETSPNKTSSHVSLSIKFDLPKAKDKLKVDIWITSADENSFDFVNSMQKIKKGLGDIMAFTPHPVLWYCGACANQNYSEAVSHDPNCVSSGRHCSPDPDGVGPLDGGEILHEDLRQLCLYKLDKNLWWQYFENFPKSCLKTGELKNCSYKTLDVIGVKTAKIEKCIEDSFNGGDHTREENSIFAKERLSMISRQIRIWPTILINDEMYRGDLDADNLYEAMCDGFEKMPYECFDSNYESDNKVGQIQKKYSWLIITATILIFSLLAGVIFIIYKRRLKAEVNQEIEFMINNTMQRYMAFKDEAA